MYIFWRKDFLTSEKEKEAGAFECQLKYCV